MERIRKFLARVRAYSCAYYDHLSREDHAAGDPAAPYIRILFYRAASWPYTKDRRLARITTTLGWIAAILCGCCSVYPLPTVEKYDLIDLTFWIARDRARRMLSLKTWPCCASQLRVVVIFWQS